MATPITHIILTDKIYEEHFGDCKKNDFILGTLLPDIRYLDKSISRESTHSHGIKLEAAKAVATCFDKWMLFHSLVDHVRNEFYISRWIYVRGWDEDFIIALKLLEDQHLYAKVKDRDEYIRFFDSIPYERIPHIKKESLDKRYAMIKQEVVSGPNNDSRRDFQSGLWMAEDYTNRINAIIEKLGKDENILHLIEEFYDSFDRLLQDTI